jgi:Uma2 family endonuclease
MEIYPRLPTTHTLCYNQPNCRLANEHVYMIATPSNPPQRQMSEQEYLAFEASQDEKHEYMGGWIVAMAGASINHNIINGNLHTTLNSKLRDRDCIVLSSDMRLKVVSKRTSYRYPDTMVICGDIQRADNAPQTVTNPIVLIEVLSPSTALADRNEKFDEYLQIPSLQAYLLVHPNEAKIERFLRQSDGDWLYSRVEGMSNSLEIPAIACTLPLEDVYVKVQWDDAEDTTKNI